MTSFFAVKLESWFLKLWNQRPTLHLAGPFPVWRSPGSGVYLAPRINPRLPLWVGVGGHGGNPSHSLGMLALPPLMIPRIIGGGFGFFRACRSLLRDRAASPDIVPEALQRLGVPRNGISWPEILMLAAEWMPSFSRLGPSDVRRSGREHGGWLSAGTTRSSFSGQFDAMTGSRRVAFLLIGDPSTRRRQDAACRRSSRRCWRATTFQMSTASARDHAAMICGRSSTAWDRVRSRPSSGAAKP